MGSLSGFGSFVNWIFNTITRGQTSVRIIQENARFELFENRFQVVICDRYIDNFLIIICEPQTHIRAHELENNISFNS